MFGWLNRRPRTSVGFIGKIPSEGDFVGSNTADAVVGSFDAWLQEALRKVRQAGAPLSPAPVSFVFRTGDSKTALAGVLAPSRDSVGREFPLAIFATGAADRMARTFPAVPYACAELFRAAIKCIEDSGSFSLDELSARVAELVPPELSDLDASLHTTSSAARSPERWERTLGVPGLDAPAYALSTFATACRSVRREDPAKQGATLDCPIQDLDDITFWLGLAGALLGWRKGPPCFFWTLDQSPRLILSLGPASNLALQFLSAKECDHPRLWPLRTDDTAARAAARAGLSEQVQVLLGREDVPSSELVDAVVRSDSRT